MSNQLIFVIILALIFEFLNGMRDSSNIVATMISSRAFRPQTALGITAVAEFSGPFLFGVVVAQTISRDIVDSNLLTLDALTACLVGTIIWNLITWLLGIPSSSSHALIGGLISAVFISAGLDGIKLQGLYKVLIALFVSPVIGFGFGFIVSRMIYFLRVMQHRVSMNFLRMDSSLPQWVWLLVMVQMMHKRRSVLLR